jgi:hypothetical protein
MIAETDGGTGDPQRLARVSIEEHARGDGATGPRLRAVKGALPGAFP